MRPVTVALVAASDRVTATSTRAGVAGAASGATELPRTVKIGVPAVTFECTTVEPPNTDCVAVSEASMSTASVMTPESVRTARRPAASLPSAVEAISTAVGAFSATSCARTSAFGATGCLARASSPATYTVVAPNSPSVATASSLMPGPTHTALGSPSRRASVSSSLVTFLTDPSDCSTRTRTSPMTALPLPRLGMLGLR